MKFSTLSVKHMILGALFRIVIQYFHEQIFSTKSLNASKIKLIEK